MEALHKYLEKWYRVIDSSEADRYLYPEAERVPVLTGSGVILDGQGKKCW